MDLGFSGLNSDERPKSVKALGALACPLTSLDLGFELGH